MEKNSIDEITVSVKKHQEVLKRNSLAYATNTAASGQA